MSTNDDIWLDARDAWGADRFAWEDSEDDEGDDEAFRDREGEGSYAVPSRPHSES
jgi:hypothetical protein